MRVIQNDFTLDLGAGAVITLDSTTVSAGTGAVAPSASAAFNGAAGLRCTITDPASPALSRNAYGTISVTGPLWRNAHIGGATNALGNGSTDSHVWEWSGFMRVNATGTGTNTTRPYRIFSFLSSSTVRAYLGMNITTAGGTTHTLAPTVTADGGTATMPSITLDTFYRWRVRLEIPLSGNGSISGWCYTTGSDTLIGYASSALTYASDIDTIRIGISPVVFQDCALTCDIATIALNDDEDVFGNGLHCGDPGERIMELRRPVAEGAFSEWTPFSGTDNAAMVNEAAPSGVEYVTSLAGAAPDVDTYTVADSTLSSPQSISVLCLHQSATGAVNDFFHRIGVYDGTNFIDRELGANLGSEYDGVIIDQIDGGGAIDDTWLDAVEISLQRETDFGGLNQKDVVWIGAEICGDTGQPLHAITKQSLNGNTT